MRTFIYHTYDLTRITLLYFQVFSFCEKGIPSKLELYKLLTFHFEHIVSHVRENEHEHTLNRQDIDKQYQEACVMYRQKYSN